MYKDRREEAQPFLLGADEEKRADAMPLRSAPQRERMEDTNREYWHDLATAVVTFPRNGSTGVSWDEVARPCTATGFFAGVGAAIGASCAGSAPLGAKVGASVGAALCGVPLTAANCFQVGSAFFSFFKKIHDETIDNRFIEEVKNQGEQGLLGLINDYRG